MYLPPLMTRKVFTPRPVNLKCGWTTESRHCRWSTSVIVNGYRWTLETVLSTSPCHLIYQEGLSSNQNPPVFRVEL